ncbi:major capsid protein [Collimonas antrihumi]|uniref:major capsid protein n=1 Tax=Collimonas antrihumi TaxID=1940615 RepID=UPI001B8B3C6D|nr:major capsid protein [Collimonas antrihumi]
MGNKVNAVKALLVVGLIGVAGAASAQTTSFDVSSAVTLINGDIRAAIVSVGTAVIGLAAVAMGIKWVKATFF